MKTRVAITDGRISDACFTRLRLLGFHVIPLPASSRLGSAVASHPDMLFKRVGDELVTTADYCEEAEFAISEIYDALHYKFHFTSELHGEKYPSDVLFNSLTLGRKIFARLDSISPYLCSLAKERGLELVNTSQGYPACTVLKLSDEAVITADDGMERLLRSHGARVYKIDNGGISLPPYEYGFIGGAAGVYDGRVYFLGDAGLHPSADVISSAIEAEGLSSVMLSRDPLADLGGIIFADGDID